MSVDRWGQDDDHAWLHFAGRPKVSPHLWQVLMWRAMWLCTHQHSYLTHTPVIYTQQLELKGKFTFFQVCNHLLSTCVCKCQGTTSSYSKVYLRLMWDFICLNLSDLPVFFKYCTVVEKKLSFVLKTLKLSLSSASSYWWKVRWSFKVHKTFLQLPSKTTLQQHPK